MNRKGTFLGLILLSAVPAAAWAADWPQFRGPNGSAVSADKQAPMEWGKDANVAWKAQVPGYGWSSPVVAGDKVFVTTAVTDNQRKPAAGFGPGGPGGPGGFRPGGFGPGGPGGFGPGARAPDQVYKWEVYCLSAADGKVLWHQTAAEHKPTIPIQASNTYATETPLTDGERVYAYFGMTGVYCYDLDGKELWHKDLGSYRMMMGYGAGASPAMDGERLYIQCDNEEKSFLVRPQA